MERLCIATIIFFLQCFILLGSVSIGTLEPSIMPTSSIYYTSKMKVIQEILNISKSRYDMLNWHDFIYTFLNTLSNSSSVGSYTLNYNSSITSQISDKEIMNNIVPVLTLTYEIDILGNCSISYVKVSTETMLFIISLSDI